MYKPKTLTYDPEREEVAQLNRDAMSRVLEESGITLAANTFNKWRPTRRVVGVIPGMPVPALCVATDGVLGIFLPTRTEGHDLGSAFLGHVHRFQWEEGEGAPPALHSVQKPGGSGGGYKGPRKPRPESKAKRLKRIMEEI